MTAEGEPDIFVPACCCCVLLMLLSSPPITQCIRRLDRTSINGYRLSVERAKTDLR